MKMYTAVHEMFRWSSTQIIRPILVKYFWSRSRHAEIRIAQFSYIEKSNGRTRQWSYNTGFRVVEVVAISGLTVFLIFKVRI